MEKKIRKIFEEYDMGDGTGAAIAIVHEGELIFSTGFGYANIEKKKKLRDSHIFDLASVSKQFTAASIMILYQEGELDLDEYVVTYVPEFEPENSEITVRDLLVHISGIADYSQEIEDFEEFTNEDNIKFLNNTEAYYEPGGTYMYNNSGYALLASVVEYVSGMDYGEFITSRIFEPLKMTSTFAYYDGAPKKGRVVGYTTSDEDEGPEEYELPSLIHGDGNIFSSVLDLAKWEASLYSHTILTKESVCFNQYPMRIKWRILFSKLTKL